MKKFTYIFLFLLATATGTVVLSALPATQNKWLTYLLAPAAIGLWLLTEWRPKGDKEDWVVAKYIVLVIVGIALIYLVLSLVGF